MNDNELIAYMDEHGISGKQFNSSIHTEFKKAVLERTSFLDDIEGRLNPSVRMWCIRHHIFEIPTCQNPECNNHVKASLVKEDSKNIYRLSKFCSNVCSNRHPDNIKKRTEANPLKTEEGKESIKRTYQQRAKDMGIVDWENYTHSSHFDDIKEKRMNTMIEHYGSHNMQSDVGMKKFKNSLKEKYGVDWISDIGGVKEKRESTISMFTEERKNEINEKKQKTWNEKYGGHPMRVKEIADKAVFSRMSSCLDRYGVIHESQNTKDKIKVNEFHDDIRFVEVCNDLIHTKDIAAYFGYTLSPVIARMAELGISHPTITSKGECEIVNFLKSFISENQMVLSDRQILEGKELDILLPSHNLAIEYNGLYWHSEQYKDSHYHQLKSLKCMEKGIQLIHIWEDDWKEKRDIIEDKIKRKLLIDSNRVYARKCKIVYPDIKEVRKLYDSTHIQGFISSSIHIGLMFDGELVCCMSMNDKKRGIWELTRFASRKQVVGGFSKLLAAFKREYSWNEIYTFASLDYSHGNLYETNGFDRVRITPPNYRYYNSKTGEQYSRYQTMKHKLTTLLEEFDSKETEKENMLRHGFLRIYDSGSIKYSMEKF